MWNPYLTEGEEGTEVKELLLLAISMRLFKAIQVQAEGCPLMPRKVHEMDMTIVFGTVDANVASDQWTLVLNWCLMAAQPDSKGDSLVAFAVDVVCVC